MYGMSLGDILVGGWSAKSDCLCAVSEQHVHDAEWQCVLSKLLGPSRLLEFIPACASERVVGGESAGSGSVMVIHAV